MGCVKRTKQAGEETKEKRKERRRSGVRVASLTLGGSQHGGGQLALAGLQVAQDEPAGEAVTHDGVQWAGVRFSGWQCCL